MWMNVKVATMDVMDNASTLRGAMTANVPAEEFGPLLIVLVKVSHSTVLVLSIHACLW